MERIILFGATQYCRKYLDISNDEVLAVVDNNKSGSICGHRIITPEKISSYEFDRIIICLDDQKQGNDKNIFNIYKQLQQYNISEEKILLQSFKYFFDHPTHRPRTDFVICLAREFKRRHIKGAIAECGVYRGWFSGVLCGAFEEEKVYLFDTFEGFDGDDIAEESDISKEWIENGAQERLSNTNEALIKLRCKNRSRIKICKGHIPETLEGIDDEFKFVNLDMDLYKPQKEALEFFSKHMVSGGVILLHDYFNSDLPGSKRAVDEFSDIGDFSCIPIGDKLSLALIKK